MSDVVPIRFVVRFAESTPCTDPECKRVGCATLRFGYKLPSGEEVAEQPGDAYFLEAEDIAKHLRHCAWSNCDGRHLYVVMPRDPSGYSRHWSPDNRASNCMLPEDREHRCWVSHGDPAAGTLHVDKAGRTCTAGAGSIALPHWHGFLHNGTLRRC